MYALNNSVEEKALNNCLEKVSVMVHAGTVQEKRRLIQLDCFIYTLITPC